MDTHRVLVLTQHPLGFWNPGDLVAYDGPLNWKFEPLDVKAHAVWLAQAADPARVENENRRNPVPGYFPPGVDPIGQF
jgi:hypothetical protein